MNDKNLLAIYGLKYNPFVQNLPAEAIWVEVETESFAHRVQAMIPQGGFALITGDPGQGKSKTLQWIAHQLSAMPDVTLGVMERPQSKLADFYREMGELFGVSLAPANRYGSFKTLREKWKAHCRSSLLRPVLLIDEAQEVSPACLTELRLLQT
ncbi:ATP-binding protein [Desulfobacter sp. UBA2225]|uniref:ATP-binding protein n=1 Tax=Desulfobacter sp. UBA2225 TaxID=1961413 RepID=UPI00258105CD|nr:ATP-binding protein [Desulfobacter sp. UBA2225]